MPIVSIDHVQLAIPEGGEPQARAFFTGLLGMREVPKPANLSPKGCWFEAGSLSLHIGVDPDFRPARKAHPALLVDNLVEMVRKLEMAGVPFAPGKPLEGYKRGDILDPFGNRIEIMERV